MSRRYDCSEPMERTRGIAEAVSAIRRGELVVLPTDTVYGVGADAFTPAAVTALLEAKGRGRDMPSPVLVGSVRAAQALIEDLGTYGQDLVDEFWPGALTLVCRANSTLAWDLGDSKGTVAVRMPLHKLALELLKETGPLAVSSANRSGAPPARTAEDAETQLGESIEVYLDDGPSGEAQPSSIVDLTGAVPRLLRAGAISEERLREICGVLLSDEDDEPAEAGAAEPEGAADDAAKAPVEADAERTDDATAADGGGTGEDVAAEAGAADGEGTDDVVPPNGRDPEEKGGSGGGRPESAKDGTAAGDAAEHTDR